MTIVWTQLIYKDLLPALCRGGMAIFTVNIVFSGVQECCAFWSAKVPKALCQSSKGPAKQPHTHQKNSGTSFCIHILLCFEPALMNTKPLRLRFGSAISTIVHLFF